MIGEVEHSPISRTDLKSSDKVDEDIGNETTTFDYQEDPRDAKDEQNIRSASISVNKGSSPMDIIENPVDFETKMKEHKELRELMLLSPSIPLGFDLNCTQVNL